MIFTHLLLCLASMPLTPTPLTSDLTQTVQWVSMDGFPNCFDSSCINDRIHGHRISGFANITSNRLMKTVGVTVVHVSTCWNMKSVEKLSFTSCNSFSICILLNYEKWSYQLNWTTLQGQEIVNRFLGIFISWFSLFWAFNSDCSYIL